MHPGARTDVRPPLRFTLPELRLGFGAWAVGGAGWGAPGAERDRAAAVERAVERGITFFDTAPSYGDGASELLVGRVLKPHGERVAIATKVGPHDDPRRSLEASLRRLQREHVDLVQLHEVDMLTLQAAQRGFERPTRVVVGADLGRDRDSLAVRLEDAADQQLRGAVAVAGRGIEE